MEWEEIFQIRQQDIPGLFAIGGCVLSYFVYFAISQNGRRLARLQERLGAEAGQAKFVLEGRLAGGFLMALAALLVPVLSGLSFEKMGLTPYPSLRSLMALPLPMILVLISQFRIGKGGTHWQNYPQIRRKEWTRTQWFQSQGSWAVYLIGYEILFRGSLLFACLMVWGIWPAIFINLGLYVFAHLPKGPAETFGSLVVGILFCLVTLWSGDVWFALLLHVTLAWSGEYFNFRANPDLQIRN